MKLPYQGPPRVRAQLRGPVGSQGAGSDPDSAVGGGCAVARPVRVPNPTCAPRGAPDWIPAGAGRWPRGRSGALGAEAPSGSAQPLGTGRLGGGGCGERGRGAGPGRGRIGQLRQGENRGRSCSPSGSARHLSPPPLLPTGSSCRPAGAGLGSSCGQGGGWAPWGMQLGLAGDHRHPPPPRLPGAPARHAGARRWGRLSGLSSPVPPWSLVSGWTTLCRPQPHVPARCAPCPRPWGSVHSWGLPHEGFPWSWVARGPQVPHCVGPAEGLGGPLDGAGPLGDRTSSGAALQTLWAEGQREPGAPGKWPSAAGSPLGCTAGQCRRPGCRQRTDGEDTAVEGAFL